MAGSHLNKPRLQLERCRYLRWGEVFYKKVLQSEKRLCLNFESNLDTASLVLVNLTIPGNVIWAIITLK